MTFDAFMTTVRDSMEGTARGKGYNQTGVDGPNALYDFVHDTIAGDGHAIGEIIYKVRRYARKGNPEDLVKAAAWAYLILKHRDEQAAATHRRLITEIAPIAAQQGIDVTKVYTRQMAAEVPLRDLRPDSVRDRP